MIKIYGTPTCGFCLRAKKLAERHGLTYEYFDVTYSKYRDQMNLNNRSFSDIINDPLWTKCSNGFKDSEKTWVECGQKCNQNVVDEGYAVGYLTN